MELRRIPAKLQGKAKHGSNSNNCHAGHRTPHKWPGTGKTELSKSRTQPARTPGWLLETKKPRASRGFLLYMAVKKGLFGLWPHPCGAVAADGDVPSARCASVEPKASHPFVHPKRKSPEQVGAFSCIWR
jgi:hypothetical protein